MSFLFPKAPTMPNAPNAPTQANPSLVSAGLRDGTRSSAGSMLGNTGLRRKPKQVRTSLIGGD